ncbi:MAG: hypothetical protein ACYS30_24330 [Planctomycetota bacterium]|jgi:hypothetical protein
MTGREITGWVCLTGCAVWFIVTVYVAKIKKIRAAPKRCKEKYTAKEKQIEGRCVKCGKTLMLTITRTDSLQKIIVTAAKCEKHPEDSIILWPQSGIRPDITGE